MKQILIPLLFVLLLQACTKEDNNAPAVTLTNDFEQNTDGWIAAFADYRVGAESIYELTSSHTNLPAPLDQSKKAIFISGKNLSDDLFMYLKKEVTGLKPNTSYTATFEIDIASNAPSNAVGVGGPPGESVYLGIGITTIEPAKVADGDIYRMNIDKGNQSLGGPQRKVIGNIANGTSESKYVLLKKTGEFTFTTSNTGTVWAMVSTDSGFESTTALYYDRIKINFKPLGV